MNILVFGDSITQGFFDVEYGGWANRLHIAAIRRTLESDFGDSNSVFALGVSGETLAGLSAHFDAECNRRRSKGRERTLTIFAYGINDSMCDAKGNCQTPIDEFKRTYAGLIEKATQAGLVILIGLAPIDEIQLDPIPWHSTHSYLEKNRVLFNNAIKELAEKHDAMFISMDGVFGDDVAGKTVDGIHPNAEGHRLMFERIRDALSAKGLL